MELIGSWLEANAHVLSFVNGLALFVLGLVVGLESTRKSAAEFRQPLTRLASYGFMAGLAHWLRLMLLTSPAIHGHVLNFVELARLLCLVGAGVLILRFGANSTASMYRRGRLLRLAPGLLGALYLAVVGLALSAPAALPENWMSLVERYSRCFLHFPGLALSAVALWGVGRRAAGAGLSNIGLDSMGASLGFATKAVVSGLLAFPTLVHLGTWGPTTVLVFVIVRIASNGTVAFFMVRALRYFEAERQRQLDSAVQQQLQAEQDAALAQRRTHEQVQRSVRQLQDLIHYIAAAASRPTELTDVLASSLDKVLEMTGFQSGHICLLAMGEGELRLVVQRGLPCLAAACAAAHSQEGVSRRPVHSLNKVVVWNGAADSSPGTACSEAGFELQVSIPVGSMGNPLGVMHLLAGVDLELEPYQLDVLAAVGEQIGLVVENSRLYEEVHSLAVLEERERLSRELHDDLAQVLGYLQLKSKAVGLLLAGGRLDQAQVELTEMQQVTRDTQRDVRELILGLRTTVTPAAGLIPTITEYVHRFREQNGICATVVTSDDLSLELAPLAEVQLLRIVQEALTNVKKHAGASRALVRFELDDGYAKVTIEDNGQGVVLVRCKERSGEHFGLQTIQERAELVGGTYQLATESGGGTRIVVRLPLDVKGDNLDEECDACSLGGRPCPLSQRGGFAARCCRGHGGGG